MFKIKIKIDNRLALSILLLCSMFVVAYTKNNILGILFFVSCLAFITKPIYLLPALYISSQMGDYYVALRGVSISRIISFIIIAAVFFSIMLRKKKIETKYLVSLLIMAMYSYISVKTSLIGYSIVLNPLLINMILFFIFANFKMIKNDEIIAELLFYSAIIAVFYYVFIVGTSTMFAGRLVIGAVNSNKYGMALAQLFAVLIASFIYFENKSKRIISIIFASLAMYYILLTGSRSAFLGAFLGLIVTILLLALKANKLSFSSFIGILTMSLIGYFAVFFTKSGDEVFKRFSAQSVIESGGTGREDIWRALFNNVIPNHLLFGVGLGGENVQKAVTGYVLEPAPAHNIVIDMLAQVGIIGSVIYFSFIILLIMRMIEVLKDKREMIFPIIMIFTALFNGIGETVFIEKIFWFAMFIGAMLINHKTNLNTQFSQFKKLS